MPIIPRFPPTPTRRVEVLAFPECQLLDVAGPLQVFATANTAAAEAGRVPPYTPRVIAADAGPVMCSAGLPLVADPLPGPETPVDTLVVAGGSGVYAASEDDALVAWVRTRAIQARRVASVCSGAFLLGAAGLIDGRRVATHWSRCSALADRFPACHVERDPIFIEDGPVWTSAGITAGIDLALALVERDEGGALALDVARQLVMFLKRPGGQAQFSATLAQQSGDSRFETLHAWMADNLHENITVPVLARQAGMSERSFLRHYRAVSGTTPARAVEQVRVEAARRMLETATPVKRVAERCGFGSEETLRRSFARLLATTPQDYRARFASTAGPDGPRAALAPAGHAPRPRDRRPE